MEARIDLITLWTDDIDKMKNFYCNIFGFEIINDLEDYVELKNDGVRFAICDRKVMHVFSEKFMEKSVGQSFELAFKCEDIEALDESYMELVNNGVKMIKEPENMPWNQRTALFEDPEGNILEIFTEL